MKIKFGQRSYENLSDSEWSALRRYLDNNDLSWLENVILKLEEFSPDMRRFIADFVTGKVARPAGKKPSVNARNRLITKGIFYLLDKGHKLTSNKSRDGAAAIIARRFAVSEEDAIKAYQKLKNDRENIMRPGLDDVTYYNDLPEPPSNKKYGK